MGKDLNGIIDLNRYPILSLNEVNGRGTLQDCHSQLEKNSLCLLPQFVTKRFISEVLTEIREHNNKAFYREHWRSAFGASRSLSGLKSAKTRASMHSIAFDIFPETSKLRSLYESEPFTKFLRKVLKKDKFFKCADQMVGCIVTICRENDELGWHYDPNDGVVTLMLQKSEVGGKFKFAPNSHPNEEIVNEHEQAIVSGSRYNTHLVDQDAGTLSIFNGSQALHRVTPVGKGQERNMAIFSYSDTPGYVFRDDVKQNFFGRKKAII